MEWGEVITPMVEPGMYAMKMIEVLFRCRVQTHMTITDWVTLRILFPLFEDATRPFETEVQKLAK